MNKPVIAGVAIAALGIIAAVAISAHYVMARPDATQPQSAQVAAAVPAPTATAAMANNAPAVPNDQPATPAAAEQQPAAPSQQYAQVVAVQPITETSTTEHPRQVCQDVQVVHQEPYKDKHQIGGAVVGGVVGGLLGHQIGGGKGKTLTTVGGAAAGALAGHEIQKKHQENNATYTTTENQCHTVVDKTSNKRTVGYDVTYKLDGENRHVRMSHNPGVGTGLPVVNGVVMADSATDGNQ